MRLDLDLSCRRLISNGGIESFGNEILKFNFSCVVSNSLYSISLHSQIWYYILYVLLLQTEEYEEYEVEFVGAKRGERERERER